MKTRLLSEEEFKSTFSDEMINIAGKEDAIYPSGVIDIFPYVESIPHCDFEEYVIRGNFVEYVWHGLAKGFDHVCLMTKTQDVYLVVVVDITNDQIHGHKLLNLSREYGANTAVSFYGENIQ